MKHFISFCFALCSIVLAAFHFTPTYEGGYSPPDLKHDQKISTYLMHGNSQLVISPVSFSPGSLPDRISIPKPAIISLLLSKRAKGMQINNLKLNEILYRDLEPDSEI